MILDNLFSYGNSLLLQTYRKMITDSVNFDSNVFIITLAIETQSGFYSMKLYYGEVSLVNLMF